MSDFGMKCAITLHARGAAEWNKQHRKEIEAGDERAKKDGDRILLNGPCVNRRITQKAASFSDALKK